MKRSFCLPLGIVVLLGAVAASSALAADGPPGAMRLLEGYEHQPLQGIDSIVGRISKEGGLQITYEIGSVPKPGGFQLGGQFSDRPKNVPKEELRWYREQTVNGQPVHLAHRKDDVLLVSFPRQGMNFSTTVRTADDMAAALLMILTYPAPADGDDKE
ncbi:MAG: hypothetical protein RIC55_11810 [Pirellulaceae bacterium]